MSASKMAIKRLQKEYKAHQADPPAFVWAKPNEANVLEWHFIFRGPPETPYEGGEYWGTVVFPKEYPFAPPALRMMTPSGRFEPNKSICTSMSEYHPGSWNVAWSVNTILVGLLSFMLSDEITTGAVKSQDAERKALAARSHTWNIAQPKFKSMFPEYATEQVKDLPNMSGKPPAPAGPQGEGNAPVLVNGSAATEEAMASRPEQPEQQAPAGGPADRAGRLFGGRPLVALLFAVLAALGSVLAARYL